MSKSKFNSFYYSISYCAHIPAGALVSLDYMENSWGWSSAIHFTVQSDECGEFIFTLCC